MKIVSYSTFEQQECENLFCLWPATYLRGGEVPFFPSLFLPLSPLPHFPITPANGAQASFSLDWWQFFMPRASGTRKKLGVYVRLDFLFLPLGTVWFIPLANAKRLDCFAVCDSSSFFIGQFNRNLPPRVIPCTKVVFTCFTSFLSKSMTLQEGQLAPGNAFTIKSANYFVDNHSEDVFSHNEPFLTTWKVIITRKTISTLNSIDEKNVLIFCSVYVKDVRTFLLTSHSPWR